MLYFIIKSIIYYCYVTHKFVNVEHTRGFSGENKISVKPEIRLNPSSVNTKNLNPKLRLKPSPVNTKFAYSLSPDFLFSPSPDFVYTRETSTNCSYFF